MSTNRNDDYADGIDETPVDREAIEAAVLEFDDANNGINASVCFLSGGDYVIFVQSENSFLFGQFETLWEFEEWRNKQDRLEHAIRSAFDEEMRYQTDFDLELSLLKEGASA